MLKLKSFAKSTLSDLKEALRDDEFIEDEEGLNSYVMVDGLHADVNSSDTAVQPKIEHSSPFSPEELISTRLVADGVSTLEVSHECAAGDDEVQARQFFAELIEIPGLAELLSKNETGKVAERSLANLTLSCVSALLVLAPKALALDASTDDRQRLLVSFSERYEALLAQHKSLQKVCRGLSSNQEKDQKFRQEINAWKTAHVASITRIEELSTENALLKDRLKEIETGAADPEEKVQLQKRLAQREAEVIAAGDALARLQDVVEAGAHATTQRTAMLERELAEARRNEEEAKEAYAAEVSRNRKEAAVAVETEAKQQELSGRCENLEAELKETSAALEALLLEKEKFMEERENAVDRRLVISLLASCLDHIGTDHRKMAEQVLTQSLQVFGGQNALEECHKQRNLKDTIQTEPLSHAFVEWLDQETADAQ